MIIAVQLFGPLAEQAGRSRFELTLSGSTVGDVVAALSVASPSLRIDRAVRFAVNTDYAETTAPVREGDVVSLIPPVGGG
ncbi:MAG TPA: MoaD/ThiS family protein [Planctomycetota bacterium]|nr:MoaD/ThiS family protein [Planctomycetota bacterium]